MIVWIVRFFFSIMYVFEFVDEMIYLCYRFLFEILVLLLIVIL